MLSVNSFAIIIFVLGFRVIFARKESAVIGRKDVEQFMDQFGLETIEEKGTLTVLIVSHILTQCYEETRGMPQELRPFCISDKELEEKVVELGSREEGFLEKARELNPDILDAYEALRVELEESFEGLGLWLLEFPQNREPAPPATQKNLPARVEERLERNGCIR